VAAQARRDLKPLVEQLFARPELVTRQLLEDILRYKRLDRVSELLSGLGGSLFVQGTQLEQPGRRLGETGKRVLVVWGAEDRIIPATHAAHAPPSATIRIIEGAGHMVQMERAGEVNAALKRHVLG
jgi:pyruvate dehydrogenase E2 component (dihydrolipoamide acetyltransferase)